MLWLIFDTAAVLRLERNSFVFGEMILRESVSMVELQAQKLRQI